MANYIHDGYTRDFYIAASQEQPSGERFHEALSGAFRPATRKEVIRHDAEVRHTCPIGETDPNKVMKAERLACEFVAAHLVRWNLNAAGIHDVPISADAMERLQSTLFTRLYLIVRGSELSDPSPDSQDSPRSMEELTKN